MHSSPVGRRSLYSRTHRGSARSLFSSRHARPASEATGTETSAWPLGLGTVELLLSRPSAALNEQMNDYIIPATSRLIRWKITVSISRGSNQSIQQHRQAFSDTKANITHESGDLTTITAPLCWPAWNSVASTRLCRGRQQHWLARPASYSYHRQNDYQGRKDYFCSSAWKGTIMA